MQPLAHNTCALPVVSQEQMQNRKETMQTVKVDNPGVTIRRPYQPPGRYFAYNWRNGSRREFKEAEESWLMNKSCPLMTPLQRLRMG